MVSVDAACTAATFVCVHFCVFGERMLLCKCAMYVRWCRYAVCCCWSVGGLWAGERRQQLTGGAVLRAVYVRAGFYTCQVFLR